MEYPGTEKPAIPGPFKGKAVRLSPGSLVRTTRLDPERLLLLVVEAAVDEIDACEWGASNRDFIGANLSKHGGLLLRGFKVGTPIEFERFVGVVGGELLDYSYRSTPRTRVNGNVFTSTEYPADQSIPLHNEMSYSRQWPMKIFFFCMKPAAQGGATPIADSRRVFEMLDPKIKARFIEKQVMYVRNYGAGLDLRWQQVFQTESKVEVEAFCRRAGIECEWQASDRLRTRQRCQAVVAHPRTGEVVWFNQAHLFHVSSLESSIAASFLEEFGEEDLPRNAFHADGSPLDPSMLDEIRSVYKAAAISFPWQEGDILLLDNILAAHGRAPFTGTRKVLVGMCEPFLNENFQGSGWQVPYAS